MQSGPESTMHRVGEGWNQFWFTPRSPRTLGRLRVLTGLLLLYALGSFTPDLWRWFGAEGILPATTTAQIAQGSEGAGDVLPSVLYVLKTPAAMQTFHVASLLVATLFTVGWQTRWTSLAALAVLLSYIHRAPMITSQFEYVLSYLVAYLGVGPCGASFSLDHVLAQRRGSEALAVHTRPSVAANISLRLIELHTAALYGMIGLSKLAGTPWWNGEAVWWLMAQSDSRLVDWTGLRDWVYLINAWTHVLLVYELAFPLVIWRLVRRIPFLVCGIALWILTALITGLVAYALAMIVATLAFLPGEHAKN